jgi:hypothetical protein
MCMSCEPTDPHARARDAEQRETFLAAQRERDGHLEAAGTYAAYLLECWANQDYLRATEPADVVRANLEYADERGTMHVDRALFIHESEALPW